MLILLTCVSNKQQETSEMTVKLYYVPLNVMLRDFRFDDCYKVKNPYRDGYVWSDPWGYYFVEDITHTRRYFPKRSKLPIIRRRAHQWFESTCRIDFETQTIFTLNSYSCSYQNKVLKHFISLPDENNDECNYTVPVDVCRKCSHTYSDNPMHDDCSYYTCMLDSTNAYMTGQVIWKIKKKQIVTIHSFKSIISQYYEN